MKKRKIAINKKVRNATKIIQDGIQFKSKLEVYCYKKLKENNINFRYEEDTFELIGKFEYPNTCLEPFKDGKKWSMGDKTNKIRPIKYTPDFANTKDGWIIECKGNANDIFPIKWKLFKHYLFINRLNYRLYLPKNQGHVDECIKNILKEVYGRETVLQGEKSKQ